MKDVYRLAFYFKSNNLFVFDNTSSSSSSNKIQTLRRGIFFFQEPFAFSVSVCCFQINVTAKNGSDVCNVCSKKGKRKVQGVPQLQTAALPRPREEEETDKSKQAQTEQTYEKH